jgi:carboxyl-terminal processing protease
MRRTWPLLPFSLCLTFSVIAQTPDNKANDAYLITRMVEKFHVQPKPLDKAMSAAIYDRMLEMLDNERIFFTRTDVSQLAPYRTTLDEEIQNRRTGFLQLLIRLYQQRLSQADTMIDHIAAKPFTFSGSEKITAAEDSSYPAGPAAQHVKLYKLLKLLVAAQLADAIVEKGGNIDPRLVDSLEPLLRKKAVTTVKRMIKWLLQSPTGIGNRIGIIYCQALAVCFDPHTAYFSPDEKAAFENLLGNQAVSYGLALTQDDEGHARIGHLEPGGPAFQSGSLSEGDRITAVRWDDKQPIDVTDASAAELNRILGTEGGDKLVLDIKKSDGTTRQVALHKQKLTAAAPDDEEDRVKGFLLKGSKTVGYISLPAFYEDWEDNKGVNGCANDVAKEIIKLRKEDIGALILDLRYNGGGSMEEAIALAGLFIDAGPVGQIKDRDGKVHTLKDMNRGTVWDGPLLVLVNGGSASASEMVAGTLQDYNRALIVGSPTFGKATAQIVLPMDTTINLASLDPRTEASSYLKVTVSKLYRVNGTTAQFSGVRPDIMLPEPPDARERREANQPFALPPTPIDANKYYRALSPLPIADEQAIAGKVIANMAFFKKAGATARPAEQLWRSYSLNLQDLVREKLAGAKEETASEPDTTVEKNIVYTVANPAYETQRLEADKLVKEMNEERKKTVLNDPYLIVAYQLATGMIKQ